MPALATGPSHHGQMVKRMSPSSEGLAVGRDAVDVRRLQPARGLLAGLVLGIEVVIARADHEPRLGGEPAEIFPYHDALGPAVDERGDVEMVAGHDHHVEIAGDVEHPVELRQRIMEIGYQEESHRTMPTLLEVKPGESALIAASRGSRCRLMCLASNRRLVGLLLHRLISGELWKLVDRNDFEIKQLQVLRTRRNGLICLLDARCVENGKEAWLISHFV